MERAGIGLGMGRANIHPGNWVWVPFLVWDAAETYSTFFFFFFCNSESGSLVEAFFAFFFFSFLSLSFLPKGRKEIS